MPFAVHFVEWYLIQNDLDVDAQLMGAVKNPKYMILHIIRHKFGLFDCKFLSCFVVCSPPATILNGKINISATAATYMCDLGYSIDGDVVRTCQADGSGWSGNDPRCGKIPTLMYAIHRQKHHCAFCPDREMTQPVLFLCQIYAKFLIQQICLPTVQSLIRRL